MASKVAHVPRITIVFAALFLLPHCFPLNGWQTRSDQQALESTVKTSFPQQRKIPCGERSHTISSVDGDRTIQIYPLDREEIQFWSKKLIQNSSTGLSFPTIESDNQGIFIGPNLKAVWVFNDAYQNQLKEWKKQLFSVEDCAARGKKLSLDLSSFRVCLKHASADDQQVLVAQRIFASLEERLKITDPSNDQRLAFRALVDKDDRIQVVFFADKKPDLDDYSRFYVGAFPHNAAQIPALEIHHLLVAPWNLTNQNPLKVSGAGTAALVFAALESQRTPYRGRVILESVPTAISFYQKNGFRAFGAQYSPTWDDFGAVMLLKEGDAQKLVQDHVRQTLDFQETKH
jgi:hypothetical protein